MIFKKNKIDGSYDVEINKIGDDRGFFSRIFCSKEFKNKNITSTISQANMSFSKKKGTLRGMHYQVKLSSEMKLVRCTSGSIFDVILDLRENSKTFKKWYGVKLCSKLRNMIIVPEGCAHGFQTLEDDTEAIYLVSKDYDPNLERGIRWNDKSFNIDWPLEVSEISNKDKNWPDFI